MTISSIKKMLKEDGGFTLSTDLKTPADGYMVGNGSDEVILDINELTWDIINELRNKMNVNEYLGGWIYEGKLYLDISKRYTKEEDAREAAEMLNEIAYYDIKNGLEVYPPHI